MQIKARQIVDGGYAELRARLIKRGYTLRSFALRFGYSVPTVYFAARGLRAGVQSSRISKHLKRIVHAPEK